MFDPNRTSEATADLFAAMAELQAELPAGGQAWLAMPPEGLLANDDAFAVTIEALTSLTPQTSHNNSLGLIVGNGYITSALPELGVDGIVGT